MKRKAGRPVTVVPGHEIGPPHTVPTITHRLLSEVGSQVGLPSPAPFSRLAHIDMLRQVRAEIGKQILIRMEEYRKGGNDAGP